MKLLHFTHLGPQITSFSTCTNLIRLSINSNYRTNEHQTVQDKIRIRYAAQIDDIYREDSTQMIQTLTSEITQTRTHVLSFEVLLGDFLVEGVDIEPDKKD